MSPTTPKKVTTQAPPAAPATPCQFCGARDGERIKLNVEFVRGLAFEPGTAVACRLCTPAGFQRAAAAILAQLADLKRRRLILELNGELPRLLAQPASAARDAAVAQNRASKTALVQLRQLEQAGLRDALERLARG